MTKLPIGTLKDLSKENKIKLKDIIRNGDKQNFRFLIKELLENKKDVNESIKQIEELSESLDKRYFYYFLKLAIEKAETDWTRFIVLELIKER